MSLFSTTELSIDESIKRYQTVTVSNGKQYQ